MDYLTPIIDALGGLAFQVNPKDNSAEHAEQGNTFLDTVRRETVLLNLIDLEDLNILCDGRRQDHRWPVTLEDLVALREHAESAMDLLMMVVATHVVSGISMEK
eukprot:gene12989-16559_t